MQDKIQTRPLGNMPAHTSPELSSANEFTDAVPVDPGIKSAVRRARHRPVARLQWPTPSVVPAQVSSRESRKSRIITGLGSPEYTSEIAALLLAAGARIDR